MKAIAVGAPQPEKHRDVSFEGVTMIEIYLASKIGKANDWKILK